MTASTDLRPVVGRPDKYGRVKVALPAHGVEVIIEPLDPDDDPHGRVYIENELVEERVPRVAVLAREEEQLGDDRFTASPKADKLYKELNGLIETDWLALTRLAVNALHTEGLLLFSSPSVLDSAIEGAYLNRNAGCAMCPCSPGVTIPRRMYAERSGVRIEVGLRAQRIRPAAKRKLSKPQAKVLRLVANSSLVRDETRTPYVYRSAGGATRFPPATVEWLITHDLVALGERIGVLRALTVTEDGAHEAFARS